MKIADLIKHVNEEIVLRAPNQHKIDEYAERMEAGVEFPPVIIGKWPKSEKYGDSGIVDGLHRLSAAKQAKLGSLPHEFKNFETIAEALTFMYTANMAHGLPVTEGQRNARIQLVKKMDPNLTLEKIADQFKLGKSSIDRILKGEQGEGKSGRKTGTAKSKAHKDLEPMKPKQFFAVLERCDYTLSRVRPTAEIVAFASPEGEDGVEIDKAKVELVKKVMAGLAGIVKELS